MHTLPTYVDWTYRLNVLCCAAAALSQSCLSSIPRDRLLFNICYKRKRQPHLNTVDDTLLASLFFSSRPPHPFFDTGGGGGVGRELSIPHTHTRAHSSSDRLRPIGLSTASSFSHLVSSRLISKNILYSSVVVVF